MDAEQLKKRTKDFAHRCVKLAVSLPKTALARHIQRQLLRSSTSVPAKLQGSLSCTFKGRFCVKNQYCDRRSR